LRISEKALEIAAKVVKEIKGRAADGGISLPFLTAMIEAAPDGDHIDIGSLFGASAITVALMKKELGHKGKVYCIDPYDEKERKTQARVNRIPEELLSASPEELMENAKYFDVELELIQKKSYPWPEELKDAVFVTAYIDGDHIGDVPWHDFENLRCRVTNYIGTDNYEEEYADVVNAMWKAMDTDDWFLYYKNITFIALRRILSCRSDPTAPFQILSL
jgi:hypothetical protein